MTEEEYKNILIEPGKDSEKTGFFYLLTWKKSKKETQALSMTSRSHDDMTCQTEIMKFDDYEKFPRGKKPKTSLAGGILTLTWEKIKDDDN